VRVYPEALFLGGLFAAIPLRLHPKVGGGDVHGNVGGL